MSPEARTYDKHWIPWTKKQLEERGITAETPLMPDPWKPNYEVWKKIINKYDINQNDILVGHSCGAGFLVRYLGETGRKAKKLILVAPAIIHSGNYRPLNDLLRFEINPEVKNLVEEVVIFVSSDDSKGIIKSVEIFSDALGGRIIELEEHGHYTREDMGTDEFPELLKEIVD